jgi:hypothetical protein
MRASNEKHRFVRPLARYLSLVLLLSTSAACKRAPVSGEVPRAGVDQTVPAPDGLVSELFIPHPDRTWEAVRTSLGVGLPASPAIFLGGALGLPVSSLDQLDFNVPIVGAMVLDRQDIDTLAAIHVKDGSRLVELLSGAAPPFIKDEKTSPGIVLLGGPTDSAWSLAVVGNYLVLGTSKEALMRSAPFVARTLPTRATPDEDFLATVAHKALAGPVKSRFEQAWQSWKREREAEDAAMRKQHGGSSPDFGDPTQALADIENKATRFFAILTDLEEARLALNLHDADCRALVSMKAASGSGPATEEIDRMSVGGAEPLLSLPASVAAALLTRDTQQLRDESADSQVEAISKVLGGRLDETDKTKVASAFHSWSKGRGDWLTAGLMWSGATRAAVVRAAVSDPGELGQGATAMLKLLSVRAIAEPLSNWVGDMKVTGLGGASVTEGAVQSVHVVRRPPKVQLRRDRDKPAESDAFDIVWSVDKHMLVGAAGKDARAAYTSLTRSDAAATLAQDVFARNVLTRLGPNISFALVVDTARLSDEMSTREKATVVLAYGKDPKSTNRAWFELDMPTGVLTSYASTAFAVFSGAATPPRSPTPSGVPQGLRKGESPAGGSSR